VSTNPKAVQKRVRIPIVRDKIGSMGEGRNAACPDGDFTSFRRQDHNPSRLVGFRGFCRSGPGPPIPTAPFQGLNKGKAA
jgi:hypothetical protein